MTAVAAWLLIVWLANGPVVVPGIGSQLDCQRLGQEISQAARVKCVEYELAGVDSKR
jgi:hypothetical protein